MKQLITAFLFAALAGFSLPSLSASGGFHLEPAHIDPTDKASLQRGAKTFVNYCLSCHEASYMRYNRMAKDLGLSDEELTENLMFASDKAGDTMTIAMRPEDAKKWFGVNPPDLSVIARSRGADWLYTYFTSFYLDDTRPVGTNNVIFPGVGMPHVLWESQGYMKQDADSHELVQATEGELSSHEYKVMIRDLVNFLAYMGEPSKQQRLELGQWVLIYLLIFFLVAYPMKRVFWRDVH
jgi:ubiquinol-cytochrome c reductase cytochrome c1 subunit